MSNATATTRTATVTTPGPRDIHVERIFGATRERVWRAFTDPAILARWWGRGNKVVVERFEFEVGGHWRFVEHGPEGPHGFEGRFREITPIERLAQTFEWDGMPGYVSIDTSNFVDLGDGRTKLVSDTLFHTEEERDGMVQAGMEGGMNESYQALDALLAANEW